ncbi:DUF1360 domain-containing protein [Texcoconibacillus texcoconensis]|nr:DUF1360 domain-containing protein [Texcoconibacillus texcoconensis]
MTFFMLILASYRFTHLIVFDKITAFIREPFMQKQITVDDNGEMTSKKVPASKFGYLLNCYWCAGIWSSIILTLGYMLFPKLIKPLVFILSVAGGQTLLESFVGVETKATQLLSKELKN